MNVRSSAKRRALLAIYKAHNKCRNGTLSAKQIERDWKQTGLRRADLEAALRSLIRQQWLLPKRMHEGMFYELTYMGECAMQYSIAGGPLAVMRDWLTLRRAKLRQRVGMATEDTLHHRRTDDHSSFLHDMVSSKK